MNKSKSEQTVIITGDIAMDWNLARARRSKSDVSFWSADDTASTTWQRGGSALLADLVQAIARDLQRSGAQRLAEARLPSPPRSLRPARRTLPGH